MLLSELDVVIAKDDLILLSSQKSCTTYVNLYKPEKVCINKMLNDIKKIKRMAKEKNVKLVCSSKSRKEVIDVFSEYEKQYVVLSDMFLKMKTKIAKCILDGKEIDFSINSEEYKIISNESNEYSKKCLSKEMRLVSSYANRINEIMIALTYHEVLDTSKRNVTMYLS